MTTLALKRKPVTRRLPLAFFVIASLAVSVPAGASGSGHARRSVYTLTNAPGANAVATFAGPAHGRLRLRARTPTGGTGTGEGLGSQGALTLSADGRRLFAVNPGSDSISMFDLTARRPKLLEVVPSGGDRPISLTVRDRLLYVLNSGGLGGVAGFVVRRRGLSQRAGWVRPLGPGAVDPAQVGLSPDGRVLVVTEKDSSTIDTYRLNAKGAPGEPAAHPSTGDVPFGFAFDPRGRLLVSNASGSASSYSLTGVGGLSPITGPLNTHQRAPCWLVTSADGRYAYLANAQSRSVSGLRVKRDGRLRLLERDGVSAELHAGSLPIDEAVGADGRFLYVLNAGRDRVNAFRILEDGALRRARGSRGAPPNAAGLAAG